MLDLPHQPPCCCKPNCQLRTLMLMRLRHLKLAAGRGICKSPPIPRLRHGAFHQPSRPIICLRDVVGVDARAFHLDVLVHGGGGGR
ncbi:uncharacterized protein COLE_06952 [Cutaneotrichosporon oleaginosum]|uniref:uncharacterized protein n=1 Tax=Cutaneotrichosporon oleaginosum TaxID=879819 RepID=UPI001321E2D6|nr:hypothetical protein COLE_06952 [Cutaneotrichosporon oleaginosum]